MAGLTGEFSEVWQPKELLDCEQRIGLGPKKNCEIGEGDERETQGNIALNYNTC